MYIDVHCHLTGDDYDGVGGILQTVQRAKDNGVGLMVCSGFDLASSIEAKNLAERCGEVYFSAGFHPSELDKYREGDLDGIKALCLHEKCLALGEIGLDYHFDDNPPKAVQRRLFIEQMELADELDLPVVLHSRDAAQETLGILRANKHLLRHGGLMHCYSYSAELTDEFLKLGFYFSFGGPCTFKNAKKVWESVQRIPVSRILSETDCPYLTPVPFRGEFPNQPKNVVHVLSRLAELKGIDEAQMKAQIENNAKTLFYKWRK